MGFSCGSSGVPVPLQPAKPTSARASSNLPGPSRRCENLRHKNGKRNAMQTALIPRSRIETLQSQDSPALLSKCAPPASVPRPGSSRPDSAQKISPAARPKPAHIPGSTAHGESSSPADLAPSASASPKHVLSCPQVYQFTPNHSSATASNNRVPSTLNFVGAGLAPPSWVAP